MTGKAREQGLPLEAGLTLIEVLIGAAIAGVLMLMLLLLAHHAILATEHLDARAVAVSSAASLQERLESEAASAWGVWVPATDVLGKGNADGHELDFLSQDASHRVYAWAYRFDLASATVTRYSYAPGVAAVAGEAYTSLGGFTAQEFAVSALGDQSSPLFDPLFAHATAAPYTYPLTSVTGAHGGNGLVRVEIDGAGAALKSTLATATAPANFTIIVTYTPSPAPAITPSPTPLPLVAL